MTFRGKSLKARSLIAKTRYASIEQIRKCDATGDESVRFGNRSSLSPNHSTNQVTPETQSVVESEEPIVIAGTIVTNHRRN